MKLHNYGRFPGTGAVTLGLGLGLVALSVGSFPAAVYANPADTPTTIAEAPIKFPIPESVAEEHAALRAELLQAIQEGGQTGAAAQTVAKVLHPHFVKEEQYALPALGLLPELAQGEVTPQMNAVLPMTEELRRNLPEMLAEHAQIHAALARLEAAAKAEHKPEAERFARELMHHALTEEQIMYPAQQRCWSEST